jgi:hypothetical protein
MSAATWWFPSVSPETANSVIEIEIQRLYPYNIDVCVLLTSSSILKNLWNLILLTGRCGPGGRFRGLLCRRHISFFRNVEDNMPLKKQATRSDADHRVGTILASSIKERLRRDLISAAFMPGEKLAIDVLRERYGAGASPVREALNLCVPKTLHPTDGRDEP